MAESNLLIVGAIVTVPRNVDFNWPPKNCMKKVDEDNVVYLANRHGVDREKLKNDFVKADRSNKDVYVVTKDIRF